MPTQAKETNGIDLLRRTLGQMSRITPRKWATAHSMIVFTMIASLCLLLMAFIPMSGAVFASTGQISDATVARATGKGPRIASSTSLRIRILSRTPIGDPSLAKSLVVGNQCPVAIGDLHDPGHVAVADSDYAVDERTDA
jgi:hypothetical protein